MHRQWWIIIGLWASSAGAAVQAQRPGTVEVSVLGVWHNKTTTMDGLRAFGGGARLGIWLPQRFEVEAQFDYTRPRNSIAGSTFRLFNLAGSLVYNIPAGSATAYLRGGYGKLLQQNCVNGTLPCSSHGALTGAAGLRVPLGDRVQLRVEGMVRNRSVYSYTSFGGSIGLTMLRTGRSGPEPDDDLDGVPNGRDRCKLTPKGALVDGRGCPTDSDGDGVFDGIDRCPATPSGTPVDRFGCPVKRPD